MSLVALILLPWSLWMNSSSVMAQNSPAEEIPLTKVKTVKGVDIYINFYGVGDQSYLRMVFINNNADNKTLNGEVLSEGNHLEVYFDEQGVEHHLFPATLEAGKRMVSSGIPVNHRDPNLFQFNITVR